MAAAPLLLIGFIAVVALIVWVSYQRHKRRREALAALAGRSGMQFSAVDPFDLEHQDFHLFDMGDGRGCENVLWGSWRGMPVKEADYWYYTVSTDANGNRSKSYKYFSIVRAELACDLPSLRIERETLLSRLADHLEFTDIAFESEAFNRAFQVKAADREFAYRLVDTRMMEWLMGETDGSGFELAGSSLLAYRNRQRPEGVPALFDIALAFRDHIPRLVWHEYGIGPAKGSETTERSAS